MFGADWRETGEEGVYEQVIVRQAERPGLQGFFHTFPDLNEYFTKDLYKKHPSLPNHWTYYGRSDNILVFSVSLPMMLLLLRTFVKSVTDERYQNGEKLNPVRIEEMVESHPQVRGAVVVGSNR